MTEMFIQTVREQMATKSQVTNKTVAIRVSFGRSKAGLEFSEEDNMHTYSCEDFGDGINFSQIEVPASPFVRMVGAVKRDDLWNKPARISKLVAVLYKGKIVSCTMASSRNMGTQSIASFWPIYPSTKINPSTSQI